jgi:RHS repeat-associated protein
VQTYQYDSFGKQTASSGSLTNPFQYTARELDPETSLYYYRARYYDQTAGRFLSEDPVGFNGGANFYAYVYNNPVLFVDPSGLQPADGNNKTVHINPAVQKLIDSAAASYIRCVREGLGIKSSAKGFLKDLAKEALKGVGGDKKERPNPMKVMDEAKSKQLDRINCVLGDCLKENPLAALALGVLTPPPGDVFEGFPPLVQTRCFQSIQSKGQLAMSHHSLHAEVR